RRLGEFFVGCNRCQLLQSGAPKESSTRRSKNAKGEIGDIQSRLATVDKGPMQQFNISLRLPFEPVGERGMQLSKSGCWRLGDNRRAYQVVGEPERLALFDRRARRATPSPETRARPPRPGSNVERAVGSAEGRLPCLVD